MASEPLAPITFYDQVAPIYDLEFAYGQRMTRAQTTWLARVCGVGRVLDVGCGSGRMVEALGRAGYWVAGLDASWPMLCQAALASPGSRLLLADAGATLPFADNSFDLVISLHATVLHLVDETARQRLAAEARRVLKPGGVFVVEVPHPRHYHNPGGPDGQWWDYQEGVRCRRLKGRTLQMRLHRHQGISTLIHAFDLDYLRGWLGGFSRVEYFDGFSNRALDPARGECLVVRARK